VVLGFVSWQFLLCFFCSAIGTQCPIATAPINQPTESNFYSANMTEANRRRMMADTSQECSLYAMSNMFLLPFITNRPCNKLHYLGHVKNVYDDDRDNETVRSLACFVEVMCRAKPSDSQMTASSRPKENVGICRQLGTPWKLSKSD